MTKEELREFAKGMIEVMEYEDELIKSGKPLHRKHSENLICRDCIHRMPGEDGAMNIKCEVYDYKHPDILFEDGDCPYHIAQDATLANNGSSMPGMVDEAIVFATGKHSGAVRKGSNTPYILHPLEAAAIAGSMTDDKNVIAAAALHDTVEDTGTTIEEIEEVFGRDISYLVAGASEDKMRHMSEADSWMARKKATIKALENCSDIRLKYVVLADKLSNLRAIYRDYTKIGDRLWDRFNQRDPEKQGWYYSSFLKTLSALEGTSAYAEYAELITKMRWTDLYPGKAEKKEGEMFFVHVSFGGSAEYTYLCDAEDVRIGEEVIVPVGKRNDPVVAYVEWTEYVNPENTDYPIEKIKKVIARLDDLEDDDYPDGDEEG